MGKITSQHYSVAYSVGRDVYHQRLGHADALNKLEAIGMNKASASFSIGNLRQMLNGAAYHRAMSINQTRHFLVSIRRDYGLPGLEKAVAAFADHLPYLRKTSRSPLPGLTALLQEFKSLLSQPPSGSDALNDLAEIPEGNSNPDRAAGIGTYFKRDPKIRDFVVKRANGHCEHCGKAGFVTSNGRRYIETHHIISLSKQGPDTLINVIGLCPDHHREAHFGQNAAQLEAAFLLKLKNLVKR